MLRKWEDGVSLDMRTFETVPVWVRFPDLHPYFHSAFMLENIASVIGSPVCLDGVTTSNMRHEFARMLVVVSVEDVQHDEAVRTPNFEENLKFILLFYYYFGSTGKKCEKLRGRPKFFV